MMMMMKKKMMMKKMMKKIKKKMMMMMETAKDSGFQFKHLVAYCNTWYHFAINPPCKFSCEAM